MCVCVEVGFFSKIMTDGNTDQRHVVDKNVSNPTPPEPPTEPALSILVHLFKSKGRQRSAEGRPVAMETRVMSQRLQNHGMVVSVCGRDSFCL